MKPKRYDHKSSTFKKSRVGKIYAALKARVDKDVVVIDGKPDMDGELKVWEDEDTGAEINVYAMVGKKAQAHATIELVDGDWYVGALESDAGPDKISNSKAVASMDKSDTAIVRALAGVLEKAGWFDVIEFEEARHNPWHGMDGKFASEVDGAVFSRSGATFRAVRRTGMPSGYRSLADELSDAVEGCETPGKKIRSKGKGRGLARGDGKGPVGGVNADDDSSDEGCKTPGKKIKSKGKGRGLARGAGNGPVRGKATGDRDGTGRGQRTGRGRMGEDLLQEGYYVKKVIDQMLNMADKIVEESTSKAKSSWAMLNAKGHPDDPPHVRGEGASVGVDQLVEWAADRVADKKGSQMLKAYFKSRVSGDDAIDELGYNLLTCDKEEQEKEFQDIVFRLLTFVPFWSEH